MIFTATDKAMTVTCPDFELEVFENTYALPEPLTKHSRYQWITFIQEVGATRKRDFYIYCCNISPFLKSITMLWFSVAISMKDIQYVLCVRHVRVL